MRRKLLVAGPITLVLVIGLVAFLAWPRGGTAVTEDEALERFRADGQATTEPGGNSEGAHDETGPDGARSDIVPDGAASEVQPPALPAAGVYPFAAGGSESVKLGPLPAETRDYPATVPVTVVVSGAGCFTVTIDLLAEHNEATTYCSTDEGGLRIDRHEKRQTVGPMKPVATMTCEDDVIVDPAATETVHLACSLTIDGGPAELDATVDGTVNVRTATVTVDGQEVAARQVDIVYTLSGDLSGTWSESLWLSEENWLPLRIERNLNMEGLASFSESSDLTIERLDPAT